MSHDRRLACAAAALLAVACGPAEKPGGSALGVDPSAATESVYPDGTVLAVDGEPIGPEDVEWIADAIGVLYPQYERSQLRRLALTNVVLPMWAIRARDADARDEALLACRSARAALDTNGDPEGGTPRAGGVRGLGIDLWVAARRLEPGVWSDPIELLGRWALVRLESNEIEENGTLKLTMLTFPFLDLSYPGATDASTSIEEAVDAAVLEIAAPAWREFVPEAYLFRMRDRTSESSAP